MKKLIMTAVVLGLAGGTALFAGSMEQLGAAAGAENITVEAGVSRPARVDTVETREAEVRLTARLVLRDPARFTAAQMNDLIEVLDAILSGIARSAPERNEFAGLRAAISGELNKRLGGAKQAEIAAPAEPAPAEEGADFDVRKVFLMPEKETWPGPFAIQFRKDADRAVVTDILKRVELEKAAKEIVDNGHGLYVRIAMDDEFAWVEVMKLVDYTSVAYVRVNKRLWTR